MAADRLTPSEQLFLTGHMASADDGIGIPPPPYQLGSVHLKHLGIRFARGVARQLLPPELEPVDSESGLVSVYSSASATGIEPFSACFIGVEVKGYDAPDGSPGHYIATGHYSGHGGQLMRRHYNINALDGGSRQFDEAGVAVGIGGPPGVDVLEIRMRAPAIRPPVVAGIRNYLGRLPSGGVCVFPIAFGGILIEAEPLAVIIGEQANPRLQLARPAEMTFAIECTEMSLTFGLPQSIGEPSRLGDITLQTDLLNSLSRAGRAAIVVSAGGEVSAVSAGAQAILGDGLRIAGGRVRATHPEDQQALQSLLQAAAGEGRGARDLAPIGLRRSGPVLIVDAVPMGRSATGRASVLLLLNDPSTPIAGNPGPALQLLGLTPAEARIAELVGSGLSPREAARRLDNSEGTVRTSLMHIYQKLEINRQSELARIVARLERGDVI